MTSKSQIDEFLRQEFPQNECQIEVVGERAATVVLPIQNRHLRPGNTVSGPVLMMVADIAMYVAILGTLGLIPLAVTTSFTINFLRKPSADQPVVGVCKLLKVGRSLVVGEVSLYSRGCEDLMAHAVGTYSMPPAV